MKYLVLGYATVGAVASVVSVTTLVKDGKDSPSKIAYYATVNGLMWPALLVVAAKKGLNN